MVIATTLMLLAIAVPASPDIPTIAPPQAYHLVERGEAILIDVREQVEIADGMATPAWWMPYSRIRRNPEGFAQTLKTMPPEKLLIFYCAKGGRAEMAASRAREFGRRVRNMGAFSDWVKAGLPIRIPFSSATMRDHERIR